MWHAEKRNSTRSLHLRYCKAAISPGNYCANDVVCALRHHQSCWSVHFITKYTSRMQRRTKPDSACPTATKGHHHFEISPFYPGGIVWHESGCLHDCSRLALKLERATRLPFLWIPETKKPHYCGSEITQKGKSAKWKLKLARNSPPRRESLQWGGHCFKDWEFFVYGASKYNGRRPKIWRYLTLFKYLRLKKASSYKILNKHCTAILVLHTTGF